MGETILVVDDEAVNRDLLQAILTEAGYQVHLAEGGAAALAQAAANPPDLILLDLLMPGMSGFTVCRQLKANDTTGCIPVIIVTALGQMANKEEALTSGADDFMVKPIHPEDLRIRVGAMLKVRRIRQELDRTLAYLHELEAARHAQRRRSLSSVLPEMSGTAVAQEPSLPPVLLVDDEALTRQFYGDLLAEHDFRVFAAVDGVQALELAARHPVEAVILDIMMPGMSGLEVLERLHLQDPDLPVIMLTSHASSRNAIAALKLGAHDFIIKGSDHELVILAVHRAVRHRRDVRKRTQELERLQARIDELTAARDQ